MRSVLVDTDVVSFLFKRDTRANLYRADLDAALHLISFMSVAELYRWPISGGWGDKKKRELENYLQRYTLIWPNVDICRLWARVASDFQMPMADAWIAATALHYQIPVITHNRSHFIRVQGLTVLSHS
jgi:predicted nucleic acid-binding protein